MEEKVVQKIESVEYCFFFLLDLKLVKGGLGLLFFWW